MNSGVSVTKSLVSFGLTTGELVGISQSFAHYDHLMDRQGPLLVDLVEDGSRLGVGELALARPAPADAVVPVVDVEGAERPHLILPHGPRNLAPHQLEPVSELRPATGRAEVVPLHLELRPLPSIARELGLALEALRTSLGLRLRAEVTGSQN